MTRLKPSHPPNSGPERTPSQQVRAHAMVGSLQTGSLSTLTLQTITLVNGAGWPEEMEGRIPLQLFFDRTQASHTIDAMAAPVAGRPDLQRFTFCTDDPRITELQEDIQHHLGLMRTRKTVLSDSTES